MWSLIFFFPGILIMLSHSFRNKGICEVLIYSIGISLSSLITLSWLIRPLHLSLLGSTYAILIISVLIIILNVRRTGVSNIMLDHNEHLVLLTFLIVLLLRAIPFFLQLAPAGADMSMHAYIAKLIFVNDGVPFTYEPLLPINNFGTYPNGLPIISAIISLLGPLSVIKSSLLVSLFSHAFVTFGLYVFLLRFFGKDVSLVVSLAVSFCARSPQWIIRWGGNPTVLSLFLFILAFSLLIESRDDPGIKPVLAALLLSATLITHSIIFYAGAFALALYSIFSYIKDKRFIRPLISIGAFFLLFSLPYLINMDLSATKTASTYAKDWQNYDIKSVYYDILAGFPLILVSIVGLFPLLKEKRYVSITFGFILFLLALLILNHKVFLLPASYLLYPGRVALLLILPISLFISAAYNSFSLKLRRISIVSFLVIGLPFYMVFYVYNSVSMCSVTPLDMDAFSWIDKTINKNAVFENNYGDAGIWIPAVISRKIMTPHGEPINSAELQKGLSKLKAGYIYIGSKRVYSNIIYTSDLLNKYPNKYKRVFSNGPSQVWKIL